MDYERRRDVEQIKFLISFEFICQLYQTLLMVLRAHGVQCSCTRVVYAVQLQIQAYNSDLYSNASQASLGTHGLCVIAILAQVCLSVIPYSAADCEVPGSTPAVWQFVDL